jgi:hypothetical protein
LRQICLQFNLCGRNVLLCRLGSIAVNYTLAVQELKAQAARRLVCAPFLLGGIVDGGVKKAMTMVGVFAEFR